MIALKLASLAQGASGIRPATLDLLAAMLTRDVIPVIPCQGSVGASGDLAPLAHMAAAMIGVGEVFTPDGRIPAAQALAQAGLAPVVLSAKEGLALLNGTQFSTAYALAALFEAERLFQAALVTGALSVDAARGSDAPFDARIHALRRHRGQIETAASLRHLMAGSAIRASHLHGDERVQDPYCLRCQPQVMGAALDVLRQAAATLQTEANGVTDNPLIFADTNEALSGGNFHAEPVAFAADMMALAICEIGALSERRTSLLIDPGLSRLPAFLTAKPGLNSGLHDPAGDGGGAGGGEQAAGASRQRRFDPDLGQPGGSRFDGRPWRAPAGRHGGERLRCRRYRTAGRGPGLRLPRAAAIEPATGGGAATGAQPGSDARR